MFNNKKGEELGYFEILDLILLILVAGSFSVFLMNLNSDTYFERSFLARDLSLMEHALYASPGEIIDYKYYPATYEIVKPVSVSSNPEEIDPSRLVVDSYAELVGVPTHSEAKVNQIDLSKFDFEFTINKILILDKGKTNGASYFAYNRKGFTDPKFSGVDTFKFSEMENLEIE